MNLNFLIMILIGLICISIGLIIYVFKRTKRRKTSSNYMKKTVIKSAHSDFFYNSYVVLNKYTLLSKYLGRIRKRIELIEIVDNWTLCRRTMKLAYMSIIISSISLLILLLSSDTIYFMLISIVIVYVIHEEIINMLVVKADNKMLKQLEKVIGDIRHLYHQHGMIEEALYDSIEVCDYEIAQHISEIHQILISDDMETQVQEYYEKAPNKFFKTFLSLCHTVTKFGDKEVDDQPLFLTNLNYLKEEIDEEILKREKINHRFAALNFIAIAPLFLIKLIELWGVTYMLELEVYYRGAYGFIADISLFIIVILSYSLISKLKSPYYEISYLSYVEEKLFKIPFIKKSVSNLVNKNYTNTLKIEGMLKTTGTKVKVEYFYIKRMLYSICGFLVTLLVIINALGITKSNLLTMPIGLDDYKTMHTIYSIDKLKDIDRTYILEYKDIGNLSYDIIEQELIKRGDIKDLTVAKESAERIFDKIQKYNKQYFKWMHLIIAMIIAMISYSIPYLFLLIRKKLVEMAMGEEVYQFHAILLMLMHVERMTVNDILEWLEQFSIIFKDSIRKCIMNFEHDDYQALEELKEDEKFTPFVRIVENLQSASEKISILKAFDTLKADRVYYTDKRKQDNEIMIRNKSKMGEAIAFFPMTFTITIYLLTPFILSSLNYLLIYTEQMETFM